MSSWENIKNLAQNNGNSRGVKVDAIHDYMLSNGIDSSMFERDGALNWPDRASQQTKMINDMIQYVDQVQGISIPMQGDVQPMDIDNTTASGRNASTDLDPYLLQGIREAFNLPSGNRNQRGDKWQALWGVLHPFDNDDDFPSETEAWPQRSNVNAEKKAISALEQAVRKEFPNYMAVIDASSISNNSGSVGAMPDLTPSAPPMDYVTGMPPQPPQQQASTAIQSIRQNIFAPYQRQVQQIITDIERFQGLGDAGQQMRRYLSEKTNDIFAIFFGHAPSGNPSQSNSMDGTNSDTSMRVAANLRQLGINTGFVPTDFYLKFGAAPICGFNPGQLSASGMSASTLQRQSQQFSSYILGTFMDLIANLKYSDRESPFIYIKNLLIAVKQLRESAKFLLETDPLFVQNRTMRANQGDLMVRNWYQAAFYAIQKTGSKGLHQLLKRSFGSLPGGQKIIDGFQKRLPVAFRNTDAAINRFERDLDNYDKVYQSLPAYFGLCWTLPYPKNSSNYNGQQRKVNDVGIFENKPNVELATKSLKTVTNRKKNMNDARASVLTTPIECYPAFLTLDDNGNANDGLIVYYASLWGGRSMFLRQGEEYLKQIFAADPDTYNQKVLPLLNQMEQLHTTVGRSGSFFAANPSMADMARRVTNKDKTLTEQDVNRLKEYYKQQIGSLYAPVGSKGPGGATGQQVDANQIFLDMYTDVDTFQAEMRALRQQQLIQKAQKEQEAQAITRLRAQNIQEMATTLYPKMQSSFSLLIQQLSQDAPDTRGGTTNKNIEQLNQLLNAPVNGIPFKNILSNMWIRLVNFLLLSMFRDPSLAGVLSILNSSSNIPKIAAFKLMLMNNADNTAFQPDSTKFILGLLGQLLKNNVKNNVPLSLTKSDGSQNIISADIQRQLTTAIVNNPIWNRLINTLYNQNGTPKRNVLSKQIPLVINNSGASKKGGKKTRRKKNKTKLHNKTKHNKKKHRGKKHKKTTRHNKKYKHGNKKHRYHKKTRKRT